MVKPRGLGRGLDALLGGEEQPAAGEALRELPIDTLQPGKYQPRTRMDQEALAELAESIKAQGVMQPILVRPVGAGRHEILAGERRWRAARIAGLATVPTLVREVPDRQALAVALIENIQRENLNPLEEATGVRRLIDEFGMTHAQAAEAVGRSRSGVTNLLRLLELAPPVRDLLQQGKIDMGHARALLALPAVRQVEVARAAVAKGMSVREVEHQVAVVLRGPVRKAARQRPDRDVARLEEDLSSRLGTGVSIRAVGRKGAGKLTITYRNLDQLDGLIAKLLRP